MIWVAIPAAAALGAVAAFVCMYRAFKKEMHW